jgi:hypothetical protein
LVEFRNGLHSDRQFYVVKAVPDYQVVRVWILNGPQEDVVDKGDSFSRPGAPLGKDYPAGLYKPV